MTNNPTTTKLAGKTDKLKLTVASTPPIALATLEKAPANKKMITIMMIFSFPAPLQKTITLSLKGSFRLNINATTAAKLKATKTGIA